MDSPLSDDPASSEFWVSDFLVPFGCLQLLNVVFLCCLKEPEVWTFVAFVYNKSTIWLRLFWLGTQYIFNAEQFFLSLQAHSSNNPKLGEGWKWSGWSGPLFWVFYVGWCEISENSNWFQLSFCYPCRLLLSVSISLTLLWLQVQLWRKALIRWVSGHCLKGEDSVAVDSHFVPCANLPAPCWLHNCLLSLIQRLLLSLDSLGIVPNPSRRAASIFAPSSLVANSAL